MRKWIPKKTKPTFEQSIACNNEFRTIDLEFSSDPRPIIRYYDDVKDVWLIYSASCHQLVPNNSFTHWLAETFPEINGEEFSNIRIVNTDKDNKE